MYSTTTTAASTPQRTLSRTKVDALIVQARQVARSNPARRVQILAAIADLEATYQPSPVETAILNARTDADLLAVTR